ncbi:MAG: hypothetical protein MJ102_07425, partial [Clostridia bacterium]|nr:hypothetical protein [Clostridia bacterium]
ASEQDSAESDELPEEISLDPKYKIYRADELEHEMHEINEQHKKAIETAGKEFVEIAKADGTKEFEILGEKYTLTPPSVATILVGEIQLYYTNEKVRCFYFPEYSREIAGTYTWSDNEINRLDSLSTVFVETEESAKEIADNYITKKAFPGIDLAKYESYLRQGTGMKEFMFQYELKTDYASVFGMHHIIISVDRYGVVCYLAWKFTAGENWEDSEKNLMEISKTFPDQKIVEDEMIKRYRKDNALPDDVECKTRGHSFSVLNDGRYAISCVVYNGDRGAEYYIVWSPYKE